jgi:electron transfer flavoprotein beta subunit
MHIVVCIKHVPEVVDADLKITKSGDGVITEDLEFDINEWDAFAVEAAVRLKEAESGHQVTVVTLGDEDSEAVLRHALAMGADAAIRIDTEGFEKSDPLGITRGLAARIRDLSPDLLLTGAQSSDDGWGQTGGLLAGLLELPNAALVVNFEVKENLLSARRELEANTLERVELPLPCALTVQTGTHKPRYVSIMGIKKVRRIDIETLEAEELPLSGPVGADASCLESRHFSLPETGGHAEFLEGSLDEICSQAARIIREKGGLA